MIAVDGKWVLYGFLGGSSVKEVNFGSFLTKRINLISTTLRFIKLSININIL